jgi:hypothetical protein
VADGHGVASGAVPIDLGRPRLCRLERPVPFSQAMHG